MPKHMLKIWEVLMSRKEVMEGVTEQEPLGTVNIWGNQQQDLKGIHELSLHFFNFYVFLLLFLVLLC
jgi:hypothetical protein